MTWSSNGNAERKLKARLRAEGEGRRGAGLLEPRRGAPHLQPEEGQAHAGRREARRDKAHEAVLNVMNN